MVYLERIRTLAKEKGLSLSYICSQIGVARIYFNDIEKHNRTIPQERLEKIADLLGTTVEYLLGETNVTSKKDKKPDIMSDEAWNLIQNDSRFLAFFESFARMSPEKRAKLFEIANKED